MGCAGSIDRLAMCASSAHARADHAMVDLNRPWRLHDRVVLRPEPFGALAYHFGTRRLAFLKDRELLAVVQQLGDHDTARDACAAVGVPPARMPAFAQALATLAATDMITQVDVIDRRNGRRST